MSNNISMRDHLSAHEDLFIYSGVAANENVGYQAVMDNEIDEESHRWWGDVVHSVLRRCAANGQLARNQNYQRVLDSVYERFPEKARIEANNQLIIHSAFVNKIPFTEADIIDLVSIPDIWDTLATSRESEEQCQSNLARERMISEMTSGGSKMFSLRTNNLNAHTYDPRGREVQFSGSGGRRSISGDEGFAGMTDEQVQAMYAQWKLQESYKN